MASISILTDKCTGCGQCAKACPYRAIRLEPAAGGKRKAVAGETCTQCGACQDACKFSAIAFSAGERARQADAADYAGIFVFCEQANGKLRGVGPELIGQARKLAGPLQTAVTAVVMGETAVGLAAPLFAYGADRVLAVPEARLSALNDLDYAEALYQVVLQYKPAILLVGATAFGRSMAPRVAARLNTGLTADCTVLEADPAQGLLLQTRPAFGGNLMATIVCRDRRPQMATVRPKVFAAPSPDFGRAGELLCARVSLPQARPLSVEAFQNSGAGGFNIGDADVLVSVGKGVGNAKNIGLARELAGLLGGAVACSRPLVDGAWCSYNLQVGQTGKTVAPKIYLALGISGSVQHMAGVAAETVVAVNTDPDAPIFQFAHYAVLGDCVEFMHLLIEQCRARGVRAAG